MTEQKPGRGRPANPRYTTTITLEVDVAAPDEDTAHARLVQAVQRVSRYAGGARAGEPRARVINVGATRIRETPTPSRRKR